MTRSPMPDMRHIMPLLVSLLLVGAGCVSAGSPETRTQERFETQASVETSEETQESAEKLVSDFTPPTGPANGPDTFGPWINRLAFATSDDGQSFTATGDVLSDQADVPDLAIDENGRLYLYYVAWTAGDRQNQLAVAISDDDGETWAFKYVKINGAKPGPAPVDPDIQILKDGTFRLYYTSDAKTHYAESTDGLTFAYKGVSFEQSGKAVLDPNTILIGETWHYFAGGGASGNWHATSSDGKTFTFEGVEPFVSTDGLSYMMANGIPVENGYRYWGFSNQGKDIHSFFTTDGSAWDAEGLSLAFDENSEIEKTHVKDSSVVELPDGTFLMVYVTQIP